MGQSLNEKKENSEISLVFFLERRLFIASLSLFISLRSNTSVCTAPIKHQHKLSLTRLESEVRDSGAHPSKRTSTSESLV